MVGGVGGSGGDGDGEVVGLQDMLLAGSRSVNSRKMTPVTTNDVVVLFFFETI